MRTDAPYREFTIEAPAPPPREVAVAEPAAGSEPVIDVAAIVPEASVRRSILPAQGAIQPAAAEPRSIAADYATPRRSRGFRCWWQRLR